MDEEETPVTQTNVTQLRPNQDSLPVARRNEERLREEDVRRKARDVAVLIADFTVNERSLEDLIADHGSEFVNGTLREMIKQLEKDAIDVERANNTMLMLGQVMDLHKDPETIYFTQNLTRHVDGTGDAMAADEEDSDDE